MARLVALLVAFCCYFPFGPVFAGGTSKQLVGSWKLISWTIQIVGGDATEPFGPNPKGRALFTPSLLSEKPQACNKQRRGSGAPQVVACLLR